MTIPVLLVGSGGYDELPLNSSSIVGSRSGSNNSDSNGNDSYNTVFFKKLVAECVETNWQISCDNCMRVIKFHTELLANP